MSYIYNENNIAFTIEKYDNVIYYYDYYFNPENYIFCKKCGKILKRKANSQKYCRECAREIKNNSHTEQERYIVCNKCGRVFVTSWKSRRLLCEECFKKDLNFRKNKSRR